MKEEKILMEKNILERNGRTFVSSRRAGMEGGNENE